MHLKSTRRMQYLPIAVSGIIAAGIGMMLPPDANCPCASLPVV